MGFTPEQFIGCWEKMKALEFWKGKWLSFAKVTENLGEFVAGRLEKAHKEPKSPSWDKNIEDELED